MAENGTLDWTQNEQEISVAVAYDDPSATPPLKVTPGQADALTKAAELNAKQMASKMYGKDVRASLAQWILLCGYLTQQGIMSLQDFDKSINSFTTSMNGRMGDVEQRMATQEATYTDLIKQLTDADTGDAAAEVIAARTSSLYGAFNTVKARLDDIDARIGSAIPGGFDVTVPHGLGRTPAITVSYYEYAIGTETDGLGTGPFGLGGSNPKTLQATVSYPDANTAKVTLPVAYKMSGTPEQHADGDWYLIDGYKVLRFEIGSANGSAGTTTGGDDGGGASTPS
ncbi:hypothetical protein [Lacticaseibacillus salsurivasis]|uniref:hypothetical protein n=1 Tax=Lacticaseibacillus salsurivasis TaxID=3081441 RepID=UPI0030C72BCE